MNDLNKLYLLMQEAHLEAAKLNNNISSQLIKEMSRAGKSYTEAVATAILSLGGVHAPVTDARQILYNMPDEAIKLALKDGVKIPGFGNSFYKKSLDPAWETFELELKNNWKDHYERIETIVKIISEHKGYKLYPNAAAFTAVVAELLKMVPGTESSLFIMARLPVWNNQWAEYQ